MGQVAVYSEVGRRRRWSDDERLRILGEAFSPGAIVTQVARQYNVSTALIYTRRRNLLEAGAEPAAASPDASFAEVIMVEDDRPARADLSPATVIDLARGQRVSIFPSASPAAVTAASAGSASASTRPSGRYDACRSDERLGCSAVRIAVASALPSFTF